MDWILVFRLSLSALLLISGYKQSAYTDMYFGGGLAMYSLLAAKFQWGCGYGNCAYTPPRVQKQPSIEETSTSN